MSHPFFDNEHLIMHLIDSGCLNRQSIQSLYKVNKSCQIIKFSIKERRRRAADILQRWWRENSFPLKVIQSDVNNTVFDLVHDYTIRKYLYNHGIFNDQAPGGLVILDSRTSPPTKVTVKVSIETLTLLKNFDKNKKKKYLDRLFTNLIVSIRKELQLTHDIRLLAEGKHVDGICLDLFR